MSPAPASALIYIAELRNFLVGFVGQVNHVIALSLVDAAGLNRIQNALSLLVLADEVDSEHKGHDQCESFADDNGQERRIVRRSFLLEEKLGPNNVTSAIRDEDDGIDCSLLRETTEIAGQEGHHDGEVGCICWSEYCAGETAPTVGQG